MAKELIKSTSVSADVEAAVAKRFEKSDPAFIEASDNMDLAEFVEFRRAFISYMIFLVNSDSVKSKLDVEKLAEAITWKFVNVYNSIAALGRKDW